MKRILSIILLINFILIFGQATVTIDGTFNPTDTGNGHGDGPGSGVEKVIKLTSGKMLVIGAFSRYNESVVGRIVRVNQDGSIDSTFNPNGVGASGTVSSAIVQNDGKIIIAGSFITYNGTKSNNIARLNEDGTLDTSFNIGSGFNKSVSAIQLQTDGKILAAGDFTMYNEYDAFRVVRINKDGSIDESFNASASAAVSDIAVDMNGNIIIVGNFIKVNDISINRIARLLSDGSLDTSFNPGTGASQNISTVSILYNKIYVGGALTQFNGTAVKGILRLNQDGSRDTSFITSSGFNDSVYSINGTLDGKLLVAGNFTTYQEITVGKIVRLNTDGSIDNTFNTGNVGASGSVNGIIPIDNNSYVISGYFNTFNGIGKQYIAKFSEGGVVDMNFNAGTGITRDVQTTTVLEDKSIILGGAVTIANNTFVKNLAKTDADGNVDTSFTANLGSGFNSTVTGTKLLSSGKILVTGEFITFNGAPQSRAAILNTDGTKDNSFQIGDGFNGSISATAETLDGKLIFTGSFTNYAGTPINRIARLNSNGTLDTSFSVGSGFPSTVNAIAMQPDGKVIIGGSFTSFNGTNINRIVRLNTDGTIDSSFSVGTGLNFPVLTMVLQPDGKLLIGGNFTTYNGSTVNRIARLNANGTLDTNFNIGTGLNSGPLGMTLQASGKIILNGDFASYNGTAVSRIFRINADGSYDNSFNIGTGANNTIKTVSLQGDKLIIGGIFNNFGGVGKNRLARLTINDGSLAVSDQPNGKKSSMIYPNPTKSTVNIRSEIKVTGNRIYDVTGRNVMQFSGNNADISHLKPGVYLIQTVLENGQTQNQKLIKE